jgi:hypothetical protein
LAFDLYWLTSLKARNWGPLKFSLNLQWITRKGCIQVLSQIARELKQEGDEEAGKAAAHELKSLNAMAAANVRGLHLPFMAILHCYGYKVACVRFVRERDM